MAIFRKKLSLLQHLHLWINFNINSLKCWVYDISSKFDFQGPRLKVKVTVAIFGKTVMAVVPTFWMDFNITS